MSPGTIASMTPLMITAIVIAFVLAAIIAIRGDTDDTS